MTSRTPLRNDDVQRAQDAQRPINEVVRDLSFQFRELPRREQAWLRFTVTEADGISTLPGHLIKGPEYATAAVVVLAVVLADSSAPPLTAAPWLSVEPVEGNPGTYRVLDGFGIPQSGTFDLLVEFVENVTDYWPRNNLTGGKP